MPDGDGAIELASFDRSAAVVLRLVEAERAYYPSGEFQVEVRDAGFVGRRERLHVDEPAVRTFLEELRDLERTRSGSATLSAMDEEDFALEVAATDGWGHVAVCATMAGRRHRFQDRWVSSEVAAVFDVDPSLLPGWVEEFASLHRLLR